MNTTLRGKIGRGLATLVLAAGLTEGFVPAYAGDGETIVGNVLQGLGGIAQDSARSQVGHNRGKLLESVGNGISAIGQQDAMRDSAPQVTVNNNIPQQGYQQAPVQAVQPSASFSQIWVEPNVVSERNGKKGIRVHSNFQVSNLRGVPLVYIVGLCDENGNPLSSNGKPIGLRAPIKPEYTATDYKDLSAFFAYESFYPVTGSGRTDLRFRAAVLLEQPGNKNTAIARSDYTPFTFTK